MIRALALGLLVATAVSSAMAADLIVDEPVAEAALAAAHDWNGAYVGAFVGYGWGTSAFTGGAGTSVDVPIDGWLAGVNVGANFQTGSFVLGVEGDVAWSGISGSVDCSNPAFDCETSIGWLGTLRARAGFAADTFLVYGTAGLAVADVSSDTPPATPGETFDSTYVGWTVGAGVEAAITEDISLKAEYLYVDLGEQTDTNTILDAPDTTVAVTAHTAKAGLNFHF